jgi:O-antigen ligase
VSDRVKGSGRDGWPVELTAGWLIGGFLVVGRWSPDRLLTTPTGWQSSLWEPRLLLVTLLVLAASQLAPRRALRLSLESRRARQTVFRSILALLGCLTVTTLWAPAFDLAMPKVYELTLLAIALICMYWFVIGERASHVMVGVWQAVTALTLVLAVLAVAQALTSSPDRLAVLGGGPNVFGRLMGLLVFGCLFLWSRLGRPLLWIPTAALGAMLVVLSGSRGSMLALTAGLAVFALLERRRWVRPLRVTALAASSVAILLLVTPLRVSITGTIQSRVVGLVIEELYLSGRGKLYASALEQSRQHPVIGSGLQTFSASGAGPYPHNIFLEVYLEAGVIGLLLLTAVLVAAIRYLWKHRRELDGAMAGAFVLALTASQFSGDLFDNRAVFLFSMLLFVPLYQLKQTHE